MADIQDKILVNLPYLRRYARMLTGSQERGDEYVRACLEAIVEEPESIQVAKDVRVELFARFHAVWSAVDSVAPEDATIDLDSRVKRSLASLPSRERQALLLVSVEGFLPSEAGVILGTNVAEVEALMRKARADLSQRTTANILIIEDDAIIALNNAEIVREMGHNVTGTAARQSEAIALVEQTSPDLILADIQLADGSSGIDAVQDILAIAPVPAIFITAFPERLLTGGRVEPTFLISKPFRENTVRAAISQSLLFTPQLAA